MKISNNIYASNNQTSKNNENHLLIKKDPSFNGIGSTIVDFFDRRIATAYIDAANKTKDPEAASKKYTEALNLLFKEGNENVKPKKQKQIIRAYMGLADSEPKTQGTFAALDRYKELVRFLSDSCTALKNVDLLKTIISNLTKLKAEYQETSWIRKDFDEFSNSLSNYVKFAEKKNQI